MEPTNQECSVEQATEDVALPFVAQFLVFCQGFESKLKVTTMTQNKDDDKDWG